MAKSAPLEPLDDLRGHRGRFQPVGIVRVTPDQNAGLESLDRQRVALEHLVGHLEAGALETLDPAFDPDPVAMGRRDMEFRVSTMGMPTRPYLWMMSCFEKPAASNMIEVESSNIAK